jgi:hypothetical protein
VAARGRRSREALGLFRSTFDATYLPYAVNMILKDLLDVGAERTPILFGNFFQLGF